MWTVENEVYKQPSGYGTLAREWRFKDAVTGPGAFNELPQIAVELGFLRTKDFPTRMASWQIYDRPNHDIPNFPDGATTVNSTLAVYAGEEGLNHAILRTSQEPYSQDVFAKDLAAFTRHYVERPRILGFPSQEMTRSRTVWGGMAVGTVALGAVGYNISGEVMNFGVLIGEIGGPALVGALWSASEKYAKSKISDLELYTSGERARSTLLGEKSHIIAVSIQRELYQALHQEEANLTPDEFLEKVYGQMPAVLINKRLAEIEQSRYPRDDVSREIGNSLPQLLGVSHILRGATF